MEGNGDFFPDGLLLTNPNAELSGNPDGTYVSRAAFRDGRVRLVEGADSGYVEVEGSPDMVLEVVSDSSVEKDTEVLRDLYWKAGILEYWIVDGRGDHADLTILKRGTRGYTATRKAGNWIKSTVFKKTFELKRQLDSLRHPDFVLEIR